MEKYAVEEVLIKIIETLENGPNYKLEFAFKDTLEEFRRYSNFDKALSMIAAGFEDLIEEGVDPKSMISVMDARCLVQNLSVILRNNIEVDSIIAKIITEVGNEEFHDKLLEMAKYLSLEDRYKDRNFKIFKKYLSTSEIANLLFDGGYYSFWDECELQRNENLEEIAEIAIKENRISDFIVTVYHESSITSETLSYYKSLVDKGANKNDILEYILRQKGTSNFEEEWLVKLSEYGFDLNLIPDKVVDFIANWLIEFDTYTYIGGLIEVIESLDEESQKKLFAKIDPEDFKDLFSNFYYNDGESDPKVKRLARLYLTNTPKFEGETPFLCIKAIPEEELVHKRDNDLKEYLKMIANSKEKVIEYYDEDDAEDIQHLLALFE